MSDTNERHVRVEQVERRKTCVWSYVGIDLFPGCEPEAGPWNGIEGDFRYCPYCGGRFTIEGDQDDT